ncbi:MAG: aldose 1-epimerase family protein [Butyrivibrio sp.]|nr:aldose 1-epimerase family protein [Butyrivibrio sp.]
MEYKLSNDTYKLTVSDHGAEIRSFIKNGKELMWQADPAFWKRTSPVLFPLVGNYFDKKSRYNGKTYEMSQHGFARDMDFSLLNESDDELWFELKDNADTKEKYPFSFILQIGYKLSAEGLKIFWTVKNPSEEVIYFSIGGHPAFNCDLNKDSLKFYKNNEVVSGNLKVNVIEGDGSGCLSGRTKDALLRDGKLVLSKELFDEDALIIENYQADAVSLLNLLGEEVLKVSFDAPLFGIWSPTGKNAPFVCIEPWYGRCDRVGFEGDLSQREYGNALDEGKSFEVSYVIS